MQDFEKIYIDLDGVLADFDRGLTEICKIAPVDQSLATEDDENKVFDAIRNADHFYKNLKLVPGAKSLFAMLFDIYGDKCEILTGVPKPERNIPEAIDDKLAWVKENLSKKVVVHTVRRADKKNYCKGPGFILVDDYEKNISEWESMGGTGILFKNTEQAMEEIIKLMDEIAEEDDESEEKETLTLKPMSSIDYAEISSKWNDKFNTDISNSTEQWKLFAYPVMPGKQATQVALIYEQIIKIDEPDCNNLYKYRILLYDMTVSPILVDSSEFQFKDWRAYTAWFLNGQLYVVMRDYRNSFDVIKIHNDGNEKVLSLGRFVTDLAITSSGNVAAGYDCCASNDCHREPVVLYLRQGEEYRSLESEDAISCEAIYIDSNDDIWAYVKPYNYICHMEDNKYETFPITLSGFEGIGVSDDGSKLLASIGHQYYGLRLYAFRKNLADRFCDEAEIILETDEKDDNVILSAAFAGNKVVLKKGTHLYMCNINELSWDYKKDENCEGLPGKEEE